MSVIRYDIRRRSRRRRRKRKRVISIWCAILLYLFFFFVFILIHFILDSNQSEKPSRKALAFFFSLSLPLFLSFFSFLLTRSLSLSLSSFDFMCLFSLFILIEVRRCRYIELSKSFSHSSLRLLSLQCAVRSASLEEDRSLFLIDLDVKKHERKKDSQTIHLQSWSPWQLVAMMWSKMKISNWLIGFTRWLFIIPYNWFVLLLYVYEEFD